MPPGRSLCPWLAASGSIFKPRRQITYICFYFEQIFSVNDTNKRNEKKQKHNSRILMYLYFDLFRNFSSVSLTSPSGRNDASIIGITWFLVVNILYFIFIFNNSTWEMEHKVKTKTKSVTFFKHDQTITIRRLT